MGKKNEIRPSEQPLDDSSAMDDYTLGVKIPKHPIEFSSDGIIKNPLTFDDVYTIVEGLGDLEGDLICGKYDSYKETKNPVYLIEAFLLSLKLNIYPPLWTLKVLAEAFQKHYDTLGRKPGGKAKTLDELLGFNGQGKEPAYKSLVKDDLYERMCRDIHSRIKDGYKIEKAADKVRKKWVVAFRNETNLKLNIPSKATLIDQYNRTYKEILQALDEIRARTQETLDKSHEEEPISPEVIEKFRNFIQRI